MWSWDITRLLGPKKWSYYYLYVIMDIYSRYVVGWMVADRENSALAGRLIQQSCLKHGVQPRVLTLHSDRGAPMTSQCTAQLLADLGVTRSLSRPQVSDDNPFSEAQFKTLKYHPSFPGRFADQGQAKTFCRSFFRWYNAEHRHGGISMLTPEQVHFGNADQVIAGRKSVLREAWAAHPERFVRGVPKPKPLPVINPPIPSLTTQCHVACELYAGAELADDPELERTRVASLLKALQVVHTGDRFAPLYGALLAELHRRGEAVSTMDLLIAAAARTHDAPVVTRNARDFERVPGLDVVSY